MVKIVLPVVGGLEGPKHATVKAHGEGGQERAEVEQNIEDDEGAVPPPSRVVEVGLRGAAGDVA